MNLKRLCSATVASDIAAYYTANGVSARIQGATISNDSASAVTVTIYLPTSGAPSASNKVLKDRSIPAGSSYVVKEIIAQVLEDGHSLHAVASEAGVLSLNVSGIEIASA